MGARTVGVRISPSTCETASDWSSKIITSGIENIPNYTRLSEPGRYYTGYLGELSLQAFLCLRRKHHFYRAYPNGKADRSGSDIFIWIAAQRYSINVKSSARHYDLMLPEIQFQRYKADYYVAAHIEQEKYCTFEGYLTHNELAAQPTRNLKILTRLATSDTLHPFVELLDQIDNENLD